MAGRALQDGWTQGLPQRGEILVELTRAIADVTSHQNPPVWSGQCTNARFGALFAATGDDVVVKPVGHRHQGAGDRVVSEATGALDFSGIDALGFADQRFAIVIDL